MAIVRSHRVPKGAKGIGNAMQVSQSHSVQVSLPYGFAMTGDGESAAVATLDDVRCLFRVEKRYCVKESVVIQESQLLVVCCSTAYKRESVSKTTNPNRNYSLTSQDLLILTSRFLSNEHLLYNSPMLIYRLYEAAFQMRLDKWNKGMVNRHVSF